MTGLVPTPGLVTYSFESGSWTNAMDTPHLTSSRAVEWASMEFVPGLGPNGLVVVIGGVTSDLASSAPGNEQRPMDQITVFDPVTL